MTPVNILKNRLKTLIAYPAMLRNQYISAGLEPVLGYNEKSCIVSYYGQFSHEYLIKIIASFNSPGLRFLKANKNGFNLMIFYFSI